MASTIDSRVVFPIPLGPKGAATWSVVQNGAAYSQAPFDMEIDQVILGLTMIGKNSAGSGNFELSVAQQGTAMWAADTLQIAYDSVHPYVTIPRSSLTVKQLKAGNELRLDVLEVFAGAATVYPANAVVTFVGVTY